jgi:hypothetical protein
MAAHIAYELEDGEVHGTLFKGMKFWVAQRVPIRNDILKMIKVCVPKKLFVTLSYTSLIVSSH